jgi:predicted RNase H-like HicB family nuclease
MYSAPMSMVKVQAFWDDEARVWVAESSDVPGLATGAYSLEQLAEKLQIVVPELLEANDLPARVSIQLEAHRELVALA